MEFDGNKPSLTSIPADISPLQNDLHNLVNQWFHKQQRQINHSFNQVIEAVKTVILGSPVARIVQRISMNTRKLKIIGQFFLLIYSKRFKLK